jgi:hypothetical protein
MNNYRAAWCAEGGEDGAAAAEQQQEPKELDPEKAAKKVRRSVCSSNDQQ